MVVGKLRMKNTDEDSRSNQLYNHRKTRRRTRSPSIDPPPAPYGPGFNELDELPSGSSSTFRRTSSSHKGKTKQSEEQDTKANDELVIQWTTTSSTLANQLLSIPCSIKSTREFQLKLKDALNVENDDIRLESLLTDDFHIPRRWKNNQGLKHNQSDLNGHQLSQLEPEEYEEYIRKRMWSQSNKKQYLTSKYLEEERHREAERVREKFKKRKMDAKLKAERGATKKINLKLKQEQRCRDGYVARWEILNSLINSEVDNRKKEEEAEKGGESRNKSDRMVRQVINFEEIPWPIYTDDVSIKISLEDLNAKAIEEFLLGHLNNNDETEIIKKKKKIIIRNAILAYHPDRFDRLVNRIKQKNVDDGHQQVQKAREFALRVSQILNHLHHSSSSSFSSSIN